MEDFAVLKAYYYGWGDNLNEIKSIELRPCTTTELGLNEDGKYDDDTDFDSTVLKPGQRMFYPEVQFKPWVENYYKRMVCFDEDLGISGNWDTYEAKNFQIQLEGCDIDKKPNICKSESKVNEYLSRSYIVLFSNSIRFKSEGYGSYDDAF